MAVEIFLKIEGPDLKGESTKHKHENEIDILTFSFGVSQTGTMHTATGGGAGMANVSDLTLTKHLDSSSPNLFFHCAGGKQFDKATLTCRKVGGDGEQVDYFVVTMEKVIITSYSIGGSEGGGDLFSDSFSLNFAKITIAYTPQKDDGSAGDVMETVWDIRANTKG